MAELIEVAGYDFALVPRGHAYHLLPTAAPAVGGRALCGAVAKQWSRAVTPPKYGKVCKECQAQLDRIVAHRAECEDPTAVAVFCAHCGKPSDRGFIQSCRACSGMG